MRYEWELLRHCTPKRLEKMLQQILRRPGPSFFFLAEIGGSKLLELGLDGRASPVGLGFLELAFGVWV